MRPITFAVATIAVAAVTLLAADAFPVDDEGWQIIKNLKDKHIWEIAEFAVRTYNSRSAQAIPLKLITVDGGEFESVADGTNYTLFVTARAANESSSSVPAAAGDRYRAAVHEISRDNVMELFSFFPVHGIN